MRVSSPMLRMQCKDSRAAQQSKAMKCGGRGAASSRRRAIALGLLGSFLICSLCVSLLFRDPLAPLRLARVAQIALDGGKFRGAEGVILQQTAYDCGPAALLNLLRIVGAGPLSLDSVTTLTRTTRRGTSFAALRSAAELLGLTLVARRFEPSFVCQIDIPLIAWFSRQHFLVVAGRAANGVLTILDPQVGRYVMHERDFAHRWSGEALVLVRAFGSGCTTVGGSTINPIGGVAS